MKLQNTNVQRLGPTPGPWQLDGRKVFSGDTVIAEAWPTTINMDEARANARLIAAAPDLLAFTRAWLWVREHNMGDDCLESQARAAIARAEGGAP